MKKSQRNLQAHNLEKKERKEETKEKKSPPKKRFPMELIIHGEWFDVG